MSGDGNYGGGGSGGWDLNAFSDWETMMNTLGGSSSSTPGTQGSATPGGYQPPNFDVDAYARPSASRNSQGLSQIREDFPVDPTPEVVRGGGGGREEEEEEEEDEEDLGRHPYGPKETLAVYNAWITVSYDPIVGNQQARKCFWEKVCEVYHQIKPKGSFKRHYKMLRSHFDRVDRQVKKFCGIYSAEAARVQSGATVADILPAALRAFYQDTRQQFKFVDVWQAVKDEERWAGGVRSSSGSTSKRTKHTASGQYSSGGASGGDTEGISQPEAESQEFAGTVGDAGGSVRGRRRPQGTKAAKAARARKGRGESSQPASGSGSRGRSDTLMVAYATATMADTSRFSYAQFTAWWNGIVAMAAQLDLPTPPKPRPPPEDDSPAE